MSSIEEELFKAVSDGQNILIHGPGGCGKCLDPHTRIMMSDGSIKLAKYIKKGDLLMGDDSTPRTVLDICSGEDEMFRIDTIKGDHFICNSQHILSLKCSYNNKCNWNAEKKGYNVMWNENGKRRSKLFSPYTYKSKKNSEKKALKFLETLNSGKGEVIDISLGDYMKKSKSWKDQYRLFKVSIDFQAITDPLIIDPYFLGLWLGDGTSAITAITSIDPVDPEIIEYMTKYTTEVWDMKTRYNGKYGYCFSQNISQNNCTSKKGSNKLLNAFRELKLINNKHIPERYLKGTKETRLQVLAGLIDTDGYLTGNCFEIIQKNSALAKDLAKDIVFMSRSLGFAAYSKKCKKGCWYKGEYKEGIYNRIYIYGNGLEHVPVLLPRKKASPRKQIKDALVQGFKITPLGINKYNGFTLDGNARFVLGNFIVTHNSHMVKKIAAHFTFLGRVVCCTATTGIAAINLSSAEHKISGSTVHSWAGVGLADAPPQKLVARVTHDERARKRWRETDLLIIDEISMLGAEFLDKLDFIGRDIRREKEKPFGGLQIIFIGDFLQLPPVNAKWAFQSFVWKEMEADGSLYPFILDEPKRYEDVDWFQTLLRFRKASHTPADVKFLHSRVKAYEVWLKTASSDITAVKPTMLNSKKVDVEYQNERELRKLPGIPKEFIAVDNFKPYNAHARFDHYIKPFDDAIPKAIYLNVGAQVMLKANLDIKGGLANGSRGVIVEIMTSEHGVKVKWLNGTVSVVTAHTWSREDKDGCASRTQIPLILAWSLTIHRCQGCTLDYCIADLGPSVFLEGQAYVALSRVRSSNGLLLVDFYPPGLKANKEALEYVERIENVEVEYVLHFVGLDPE